MMGWPPRAIVRKDTGNRALEMALHRRGLGPVAGVDEAGRGACAGPLVVAACILPPHTRLPGLDDSKKLSEKTRNYLYPLIMRAAMSYHIVSIPAAEIDEEGVHRANIDGMRRAVAGLGTTPGYVLTDGFRVPGIPTPSLPVIGGDASSACIAAASVLAKVTRDRTMIELDEQFPVYGFAIHKGYSTGAHTQALNEFGPSAQHRRSYANVARAQALYSQRVAGHA
ncbi:ribonuclease HII [Hoyosella rhizosphaerae]|nr:ribonuclease HII [Hoyosella rhizosphaerae]MBN4926244.1 ribonuclease HII [Hoyosella rhizosphaerae]